MSKNYYTKTTQNPNDPLHIVMFASRNKDQLDESGVPIAGYSGRRNKAFLYHVPETDDLTELPDKLIQEFEKYVNEGVGDEMSRLYVSLNARDPKKIKQMLMHRLIDDDLPGKAPLTTMETVIAGLAAKKECAAERKWLFDFDVKDTKKLVSFVGEIAQITNGRAKIKTYPTPHGYAVTVEHGFWIERFSPEVKTMFGKGEITLKKDDLLCVRWQRK